MLELETIDGFPVVSLYGDIDLASLRALEETLDLLDLERVVIISLERAEYLDSTVPATLVREHLKLGGNVIIVLPEGSGLSRIFDRTGLRTVLRFVPDRVAAVKAAILLRDVAAASFSRDGVKVG